MGSGDYINKLVKGVRREVPLPDNEVKAVTEHLEKFTEIKESLDFMKLLDSIRNFEVKGEAHRLIRIDARTEGILKHVKSILKIDVTTFVNFLCWDFLENHPELINKIKQSPKRKKA